uniref:Platelet endothelial cell adhesion molecule n=1 Tax=Anser brachyrhynchus TaxID=132585 RepID=A0A8B9BY40_9AVES
GIKCLFFRNEMYLALLVIFLQFFTFNSVEIRVEPSVKVKNGAPMSITCRADISKSANFHLQHNITIFKDGKLVFMIVSDKGVARYEVPVARSSDTGDYECTVKADGKIKSSNSLHVWVTGMTKPILTAEKREVLEGEVVKLRCELPEEVPPLHFFFRKIKMNSTPKEKHVFEAYRNFSVVEFSVEEGDNILQFDCFGKRNVKLELESSEPSNRTLVTSSSNITEGDRIEFECSTVVARMRDIEIILQKNKTILNSVRDEKLLKYSAVATLEDSGEYLCKVEQGRASKTTKLNVVVAELFPKPILSASMSKLDENKELTLSCSISGFRKANFSILRRNSNGDIWLKNSRNLTMRVNVNDTGSYICKAEVKGIVKESKPVRISTEVIWMTVLQKSQIFCYLYNPLTSTLLINTLVSFPIMEQAQSVLKLFYFLCNVIGHTVFLPVLAPVSKNASLGSIPYGEVEDGSGTAFLCSVEEGSWPIHFRIFKKTDHDTLLYEKTESTDRIVWHKETMSRQDTGTYYCMVSNRAKVNVKSHPITINGKLTFTISCTLLSWQVRSCYLQRPDLESAEVEYTEVEVSTLDPHRGNKLSGIYGYDLGVISCMLLLPDSGLTLASMNVRAGCALHA